MSRLRERLPYVWIGLAAVCYSAVLVSPGAFWPAAFVAMFGIPLVLVGSSVVFLVAILGRWSRHWLISLGLTLCLGIPFWRATFGLDKPVHVSENSFRVISFNLGKQLNSPDRLTEKRYNHRKLTTWLTTQKAEVLLLQEVFNYAIVPEFRIMHTLKKGGYPYRFFARHTDHQDTVGAGMAITSIYPLTRKRVVYSRPGSINMIIKADCETPKGTVRLINVHLESIRLTNDDLSVRSSWRHTMHNFREVIRKMRKAYIVRSKQVDALTYEVKYSKYPVLLGGDFNDTPYSYTYWKIRRELTNSFEQSGSGLGNTFNGKVHVGLRIDHQFYQKPLKCLQLTEVDSLPYSDHFALEGRYVFSE